MAIGIYWLYYWPIYYSNSYSIIISPALLGGFLLTWTWTKKTIPLLRRFWGVSAARRPIVKQTVHALSVVAGAHEAAAQMLAKPGAPKAVKKRVSYLGGFEPKTF